MRESVRESGNRQETSGSVSDSYFSPANLNEVLRLLAEHSGELKVLAGGTDLMVDYYERLGDVKRWLDLKDIAELKEIAAYADRFEIGPMVTHTEIEKSEGIKKLFPVLCQAASEVGSPQIRNRGTIGGNIVTSSPAGDLLAPLIAYDARFRLLSTRGERLIPAADFFTGPKENKLAEDELLAGIIMPLSDQTEYGSWQKIGRRKALIISSLTLALVIRVDQQGTIDYFKACLGAVAPVPLEIGVLQELALGKQIKELDFLELGEIVSREISPIDDLRGTVYYRRETARHIMVKALTQISQQAGGGELE